MHSESGKKQCHGCHNKGWIEVNDQSIQVQQDDDGILWLIVKSKSGKCGMLNLNELENQLCREAFLEWGDSFANNHFQSDQKRAEQISLLS